MLVVHAEFMSVQPSELLERPPYVNTGESSQFLYHLTANHMNYRCTSFRIQGTESWGWGGGNEKYCFFIQQIFASSFASPCRNHIVEDLNREQKFLLALIILPEVFLFFPKKSVFHYV